MNAGNVFLFMILSSMTVAAQGAGDQSRELGFWTWVLMVAFSISAVVLVWWGRSRANRF